ncbi:MAG: hypothetical protein R3E60_01945 [Alphaproteobacteria bacterium]
MTQGSVILFLSCGRTGTQWFADKLAHYYSDLAEVVHEPMGNSYQSVHFFRQPSADREQGTLKDITRHFQSIHRTLSNKHYIESGWPAYAAIPAFYKQFPQQFRLVHMVRNPLHNAASMTTLHFYQPRNDEEATFFSTNLLTPETATIKHLEYRALWNNLSIFEKNLFQWLEINSWGEDLQALYPEMPYHQIKFENLFGDSDLPLRQVLNFIGLPIRPDILEARHSPKDDHRSYTHHPLEPEVLKRHPRVLQLAYRYGYADADLFPNPTQLAQRYSESHNVSFGKRLERWVKRLLRS